MLLLHPLCSTHAVPYLPRVHACACANTHGQTHTTLTHSCNTHSHTYTHVHTNANTHNICNTHAYTHKTHEITHTRMHTRIRTPLTYTQKTHTRHTQTCLRRLMTAFGGGAHRRDGHWSTCACAGRGERSQGPKSGVFERETERVRNRE